MRVFFGLATVLLSSLAVQAAYTGPCSTTDCGENHLDCRGRGNLCVPYPSTDPALRQGCTCSTG
ncbi:hypothetical protein GQ53DRAFT_864510 [Thozetella sp. PMI_491]|nr:hypothetical protein GQ53DRAFT_864510 [Thozetella sp. PMI_491]